LSNGNVVYLFNYYLCFFKAVWNIIDGLLPIINHGK
jgi:hypothetical protein